MITTTEIIIIIIRGARALTNLGRLSSRRWQSYLLLNTATVVTHTFTLDW
jgi:hypothetical protein